MSEIAQKVSVEKQIIMAGDISLSVYSGSIGVHGYASHSNQIFDYNIKIKHSHFEEDDYRETKIGKASAVVINNTLFCNLEDICDGYGEEMYEMYSAISDKRTGLVKDKIIEGAGYHNILYIKSIELMPQYRGQGLAGILARLIANVIGIGCIVVLMPWPVNGNDGVEQEEKKSAAIAIKLRRSYKKVGFVKVDNSKYMYLSSPYNLANVAELAEQRDSGISIKTN